MASDSEGERDMGHKSSLSLSELGLTVLVLLALILPCAGQQVNATFTGTVRDASGAAVPEATLTVKNESTGAVATTISDEVGNYIFPSLAPATYTLSAQKSGFNTTVISGVTLSVYQKATMDVVLRVGQVRQTVEVKGGPPLVNTSSASIGTLIGERESVVLPLNARRTSELALLVPGIVNTS